MRTPRINRGRRAARRIAGPRLGIAATAAVVVVGVPAALAFHPFAGHARATAHATGFTLSMTPTTRTIEPAETVQYRIVIHRAHGFHGAVSLITLGGFPSGSQPRIAPAVTRGSSATLSVTTASTKVGTYHPHVRGISGHVQRTMTFTLLLRLRPPGTFTIAGSVGDLHPGTPGPLNLSLTNPAAQILGIGKLSVSLQRINAPNATPSLPCNASDFSIQQFAGSYPVVVPPSSTRTLAQLGIPAALWPQVSLVNRAANQDGCKGASLTLAYSGGGLFG